MRITCRCSRAGPRCRCRPSNPTYTCNQRQRAVDAALAESRFPPFLLPPRRDGSGGREINPRGGRWNAGQSFRFCIMMSSAIKFPVPCSCALLRSILAYHVERHLRGKTGRAATHYQPTRIYPHLVTSHDWPIFL